MDFEKKILLTKLYDIYYELLTNKQQQIFEMYVDDDYSVTEIALKLDVSVPNVSKSIKNIAKKLEKYEESLQILTNYEKNIELLNREKVKNEIIKKIK